MNLTIRQVHKKLLSGELQPSQLCKSSLARGEAINDLNAFITLSKTEALLASKKSDERFQHGSVKGILDGVPFAVKDNFATKGITTTCASKMLQNFIPSYNATVVKKLQVNGATLIGKCNLDEFAMGCGTVDSLFGPTKNIWGSRYDARVKKTSNKSTQDWYIAGGSSGGSAVAVASGTVFAALGSDTGGSTRNPAAYCGVVGLKPTYGLLSRYGLIPLVNSMDVPGILARNVDDATLLLNCLAGHDIRDSTTYRQKFVQINADLPKNLTGINIGLPVEYHCPGMSSEILKAWTKVADLLDDAGGSVTKVSLPHTEASISCYSVLNQCEVASNMARYDGIEFGFRASENKSTEELFAATRSQGFGHIVRSRILAGNYFLLKKNYERYFVKALKLRRLIAEDFLRVWKTNVDVLLTPVTLSDAPKYSDFICWNNREQCSQQDYCTQPVNMAGCPAISIPIELSAQGLPISLQLIAPNFKEDILIKIAKYIENAVQFPSFEFSEK